MSESNTQEVTELLQKWSGGDADALEQLTPVIYSELHRIAKRYMNRERDGHTLQTTALVNEAYMRLIDWKTARWENRAHFFGVSAQLMRRILVDFARKRPKVANDDRELTRAELSPDGKQFLMRQIRRTQDDIVIINREGNTWRDLTNDLPYDRYPRWSPDGSQIAFASDRGGGYEIWICNSDGTNLRQITFQVNPVSGTSFPTWSPDGKRLIYNYQSRTYLLDLSKPWNEQTPEEIPQTENGAYLVTWDWSPDGKKLVGFYAVKDKGIGVYSFETKSFVKISNSADTIPSFLPDSRHIVFTEGHKILLGNIETKEVKELLTAQPEIPRSPFVSRDGKLLYYIAQSSESDIWLLDNSNNP